MAEKRETLIKRYESTAQTYQEKADRCYARAKNGYGDHYYGMAKKSYETAGRNRAKADRLKKGEE